MVPLLVPALISATIGLYTQVQEPQQQTRRIGNLVITYDPGFEADLVNEIWTFSGIVTVTYDQTRITCQKLTLDLKSFTGVAEGGVELYDPEAYLSTDVLEFNWQEKTGYATNVFIQMGNMRIVADTLEIAPDVWRLEKAQATLSRQDRPKYEIVAERVRIYPGKYGIAQHVALRLFGSTLGWVPEMRFDLDPRIQGFQLPAFAEKKGVGFGVSWSSSFFLNSDFLLAGVWNSFPHRAPGYSLQLTYLKADPDKVFRKIEPRSDLDERFRDSWFDNVAIRLPSSERRSISAPRVTYSIQTKWNQSTFARPLISNTVSKELELSMESAGMFAGNGARINARAQRIRGDSNMPFVDRFALNLTTQTPSLMLSENLGVHVRADVFGTYSADTEFGWLRGQVAMIWNPNENWRLGIGYSNAKEFGKPDFQFDRLFYKDAVHARADFNSGPYTLRYMVKYDPVTSEIFDNEYEIALVAESFEPFIIFRKSPSDFRMGIRFKIDTFRNRLKRRSTDRRAKPEF